MKLFPVFVFFGNNHAAIVNSDFDGHVTGFHRLLKPYPNPNPNADYSDDPAFDPSFEDLESDKEDYNVFDFLQGRMQTRRSEKKNSED